GRGQLRQAVLMAAKLGLVLDCADPERLATFWSAALGYTSLGTAGNYVLLVDEAGQQPKLLLQRVSEPKAGKNRMHVDIETPTVDEEVARLEQLGARRIDRKSTRLNSSHVSISYAVFCLKKKKTSTADTE